MRTKKGNFGKVIGISNVTGRKTPKYLIKWTGEKAYYISQVKDVKHSKNIIDLIEVGDYVNGQLIENIHRKEKDRIYYEFLKNQDGSFEVMEMCELKNIKSIVTKEKFASMEYRLEV